MENHAIDLFETNGDRLLVTTCLFLAFSWVAVGLRTYTRVCLVHAFRCDDWIMLIAQATFTVYSGFLFAGLEAGIGRHNAAIEDDTRKVAALKWQAFAVSMYIVLMMLVKLSIGFFLLRLTIHMPGYVRVIWTSLALICISTVIISFWNIFQCIPVEKQWDYRLTYGRCVRPDEIVAVAYVVSAMTIVTDFFYALIPIPMIWNVRMTTQAKLTVVLILGMGLFASVATIVRIRLLPTMANLDDALYAGTDAMLWTIVEAGLAIIAASLATLRPLLRVFRVQGFESAESCERSDSAALQVLEPPSNRQRRFFQFYGIDDMPLTNDARTGTMLYFPQDDTKPHSVQRRNSRREPRLSQSEISQYWEDTEHRPQAGHHGITPMTG